jgi:hypothetical protein
MGFGAWSTDSIIGFYRVPDAPTTGVCGARTSSTVSFSWTNGAFNGGNAITSYTITYQLQNQPNTLQTVFLTAVSNSQWFNSRSYTLSNLQNGQTYDISVASTNGAGTSAASSFFSCLVCVTPSAPFNLQEVLNSRNVNTIGLQWSQGAANGATGVSYSLSVSYNDQNNIAQTQNIAVSGTSYTMTNAVAGRAYTFVVTATNLCGTVSSNSISLTGGYRPNAVTNVATNVNGNQVTCSWT